MTMKVADLNGLIGNTASAGGQRARRLLLCAYEEALTAVDPAAIIAARLRLEGSQLSIGQDVFNLDRFRNIQVIGAGKAGKSMATAIHGLLGDRIGGGCVNVPHELDSSGKLVERENTMCGRIRICGAGHPVPDEAGVAGARCMMEIAEAASADDLVICLISGGGSSLLPLPRGDILLAEKRQLTSRLLRSGATISEINTVRKHISAIKGGWLAKRAWPAMVINLVLSDVPGDPLEFIASGPTVADSTTFADAAAILQRYALFSDAPAAVQKMIADGMAGLIEDTPGKNDPVFARVHNYVTGNNATALAAVEASLRAAGMTVDRVQVPFTGDVAETVSELAARIRFLAARGGPAALVAGGEVTVKVTGSGVGGRNQEMALAMAINLGGMGRVTFAALSTDGIDGPTGAAGAIIDAWTLKRAGLKGLEPQLFMQRNDSNQFFSQLGDLVCTGYTGTNVNDLYIALINQSDGTAES